MKNKRISEDLLRTHWQKTEKYHLQPEVMFWSFAAGHPDLDTFTWQGPSFNSHEAFSPAQTLGSRIRIPVEALMYVRVSSVFVLSCVRSGLATGWSPVPTLYKIHSSRLILRGNRPEGLMQKRRRRRRKRRYRCCNTTKVTLNRINWMLEDFSSKCLRFCSLWNISWTHNFIYHLHWLVGFRR
jgi:hypothetical protein